jgi:hypothetical protein
MTPLIKPWADIPFSLAVMRFRWWPAVDGVFIKINGKTRLPVAGR